VPTTPRSSAEPQQTAWLNGAASRIVCTPVLVDPQTALQLRVAVPAELIAVRAAQDNGAAGSGRTGSRRPALRRCPQARCRGTLVHD